MSVAEPIIDPGLPIVDAHHHLWVLREDALEKLARDQSVAARAFIPVRQDQAHYLLEEYMADATSGHNIRATVFVDAHAMYRANGPAALKSLGEVEFANGMGAMAESGTFGDVKVCAGIVGNVDLTLGDRVEEILQAHIQAGGKRYRGVRCSEKTAYDADTTILGPGLGVPHFLLDERFRAGFKSLRRFDLSFDAWLLEPQLPDLIDLARAFPETQIILDHVGGPVHVGRYAGKHDERFAQWRDNIQTLAGCSNVSVKLGGLGLPMVGLQSFGSVPASTSAELAAEWRPYIETCIQAFGCARSMFESNFPVDTRVCTYAVLWNAFKRIAAGASADEREALFHGTATRIYRLND